MEAIFASFYLLLEMAVVDCVQITTTYPSCTWKDILDVPGEQPVNNSVDEHHEDGHDEGVAVSLFWTHVDVVPLDSDALLLVLGKGLAAVAEGNTGQ